MGYILPIYLPHPIFDFLDPEKTKSDLNILRAYFESNDASNVIRLLEEHNKIWAEYLEKLLKARRLKLFNSEHEIPDEKAKIDECAQEANNIRANNGFQDISIDYKILQVVKDLFGSFFFEYQVRHIQCFWTHETHEIILKLCVFLF